MPYRPPFTLLRWALGIAGLAIAFPIVANALLKFEIERLETIGLGFGLAFYFGSFLMLALSGVLAVWAMVLLGLMFVLNRFASLKD
ncbi:hypothetical protein [Phaeobacter sp. C3_T13_0]|uniref:hypothetical protein n=1 Tax=Phaeobacter cretensis TaxID=3342641 RepID=UPI0039BCBF6E